MESLPLRLLTNQSATQTSLVEMTCKDRSLVWNGQQKEEVHKELKLHTYAECPGLRTKTTTTKTKPTNKQTNKQKPWDFCLVFWDCHNPWICRGESQSSYELPPGKLDSWVGVMGVCPSCVRQFVRSHSYVQMHDEGALQKPPMFTHLSFRHKTKYKTPNVSRVEPDLSYLWTIKTYKSLRKLKWFMSAQSC